MFLGQASEAMHIQEPIKSLWDLASVSHKADKHKKDETCPASVKSLTAISPCT